MEHPIDALSDPAFFFFPCPHCGGMVQVARGEVNCAIFRHLAHRITGAQINPHAREEECRALRATGDYEGCGNPFRMDMARMMAVPCGFDT